MRLRNLILMVLAVMCTSQVMAQSKRNVRKRPAKRTVVNNTKKPVHKTKEVKVKRRSKDYEECERDRG